MIRLPIAELRMEASLQPREILDELTIADYAERMREGDTFPPVVVFFDGTEHLLADGYHRTYAAMANQQTHMSVTIRRGDRAAAQWYSYSANKTHGLGRTNKDKVRAVEAALSHPNAATLTDVEIAHHCGVDRRMISAHRAAIMGPSHDSGERQVTRNGTTYNMKVRSRVEQASEIVTVTEQPPTPMHERGKYLHTYWNTLPEAEQRAIIDQAATTPTEGHFNTQETDNIEWARFSWNPVTGCYHDCIYCYARDYANRIYEQKFDATFIPDRLSIPRFQTPPPDADHLIGYRNVFTCSMADLFGKWVPQNWIDAVLDTVRESPQWNFLFLTKFPIRLAEQTWPDNAWVGCTVDSQPRVASAERAFSKVKAGIKWLSCEPLLTPLKFTSLAMFDWVVIGGQSRSSQAPEFQPQWEWVASLEDQARAAGCKVYYKTNLLVRPKEYPGA